MIGPRVIKVTDRTSCVAPPMAVKEWTDTLMVVFDFANWLGPDQHLSATSDPFVQFNPQQAPTGLWAPFLGCCSCSNSTDPPPEDPVDSNPVQMQALEILPGGKTVGLSLSAGTPGFAYIASFITTAGPYPRRKEVGVLLNVNGCPPVPGETPPVGTPVLPQVIDIYFSIALGQGFQGDVNVMSGGITITLPPTPGRGQEVCFKDVTGAASHAAVTINTGDSTLIDGQTAFYMFQDYQAVCMYWTGTGWGVR